MAEAFMRYVAFKKRGRNKWEKLNEFIADWENLYEKVKQKGCSLSDMVLAFKLLEAAKLTDIETNLVLTGVDFVNGKTQGTMLSQVKESLRKFVGRTAITDERKEAVVKAENTYVTKEELALAVKKFKKRERTRSKSVGDDPGDKRGSTYKGKKNPLGRDFKPLKCFKCKCDCEGNCNHPCVYHLADKCNTKSAGDKEKPSLNLFMKNSVENIFFTECKKRSEYGDRRKMEDLVLISEDLKNYCLVAEGRQVSKKGLIDCACPSTVVGSVWIKEFLESLPKEWTEIVSYEESEKVYKFGDGEIRESKGTVIFPCNIANKDVRIRTEVIDADLPLLIGNTTLNPEPPFTASLFPAAPSPSQFPRS